MADYPRPILENIGRRPPTATTTERPPFWSTPIRTRHNPHLLLVATFGQEQEVPFLIPLTSDKTKTWNVAYHTMRILWAMEIKERDVEAVYIKRQSSEEKTANEYLKELPKIEKPYAYINAILTEKVGLCPHVPVSLRKGISHHYDGRGVNSVFEHEHLHYIHERISDMNDELERTRTTLSAEVRSAIGSSTTAAITPMFTVLRGLDAVVKTRYNVIQKLLFGTLEKLGMKKAVQDQVTQEMDSTYWEDVIDWNDGDVQDGASSAAVEDGERD